MDMYRELVTAAGLPSLQIVDSPSPKVDIFLGEPTRLVPLLPQLPSLIWAHSIWAGIEPLLDDSLRRDYILTNARGIFGGLMSEFVFGYMLLHERKILQRLEAQKIGRWDSSITGTLRGKTIGLLGVGSIGGDLAATARHFNMKVRGYTVSSESCPHVDRYFHPPHLADFASGLDYLVSVLPDTGQTARLVDTSLLACLPPGAIFINVGRGNVLDEAALIQALRNEKLAGAVLDVFEQEPLPADNPLWHEKNVFITSHSAAPSFPNYITALFLENYRLLIDGQPLKYRVNFERGY